MTFHRQTFASLDEIERLLHHMPTVARTAETDFAKGFAKSIIRQSRRHGWGPSPKQLSIMRALVAELFLHGLDEGEVIENAD